MDEPGTTIDDDVVDRVVRERPGVFDRTRATLDSYERRMTRLRDEVERRRARLEADRRLGVWVVATRRFASMHGGSLSGQLTLSIFAGVIPIIVIAFAWATAFSSEASVAEPIIRQLGLTGETATLVRETFAASSDAKEIATLFGIGSFLLVGYTLGTTMQETFARAWQLPPMVGTRAFGRGVAWFALFLVNAVLIETIRYRFAAEGDAASVSGAIVSFATGFAFWLVTPRLLLDVRLGWRGLVPTGIAGAVGAAGFRLATGFVLPSWLNFYALPFGALGVILAFVFWVWVLTYIWVVVAAVGAAWWERSATAHRVLTVQTVGAVDEAMADTKAETTEEQR